MAKNLVIVESPAKVKTIKKFLGSNYEVVASYGHVRDLPKSTLGIDVDNDYEPKYITIRGKGDVLSTLRKEVKKADKIYLATDPDREGEAISWHITESLKLDPKKTSRITFNEITKTAVKESLKNARSLDMNLVDAQQTRRILDRMVGYKISPILWAKVKRGLSAGRVQSVALRIICDRETEIDNFVPEEYWSIEAGIKASGVKNVLNCKYYGTDGKKQDIKSEEQAKAILADVKKNGFTVSEIKSSARVRKAPLAFTTSTLQQEASKALNFSSSKTMRIAQKLYEGVNLGSTTVGIITYLRTDSTRVSDEAESAASEYIKNNYSEKYLRDNVSEKKSSVKIQDAHEAIRPTSIERTPASVKEYLSRDELRLYTLIWKRFAASRMADAVYDVTTVKLASKNHIFTMSASKIVFDGFMCVYMESLEETDGESESNSFTGNLDKDSKITLDSIEPKQHFTQPPAHYTEASLIRTLEELGIGRPSTYAPTISTILARHYVAKDGKNIFATELGTVVDDMMKDAFPEIVDVSFTANMETLLDGISEGEIKWKTVVANFYPDFAMAVTEAEKDLEKVKVMDEVSDEVCSLCGRNMVVKYGPHGKFLACPGFPECKNTMPYFEKVGVPCPKCGKDVVIRMTKKGKRYYGCMAIPDCDFMVWQKPVDKLCEKCGSIYTIRGNKLVCSNPSCAHSINR